jgi:RecB family endonuclease NucS
MPIYHINKENLIEKSETQFDLEKDIQTLVEGNMKTISNLEFITTEFQLDGLRIDSLGFDRQSKSFTIIEYKSEKRFLPLIFSVFFFFCFSYYRIYIFF